MDPSRVRPRTVALAVLCLAVIAFAAATLDTTTNPDGGLGMGNPGQADQLGGQRTPATDQPGDSRNGSNSPLDLDLEDGPVFNQCVQWLRSPLVQIGLVLGLVGLFFLGRWYDDAMTGVAVVIIVAYPGVFVYLLLTACRGGRGQLIDLSNVGRPSQEGGGLVGGASSVKSPDLTTQLLLILVLGTLVAVTVLVLTGDHDQTDELEEGGEEDEPEEATTNVAAVGAAAGRAADRLEADGEFENEVYRAWAEMTAHLAVEHPESSTPSEFARAAVAAGIDEDDVTQLTDLFAEVRYGGLEPTSEREAAAVETLRRIEATYADADTDVGSDSEADGDGWGMDDGPGSGTGPGGGTGPGPGPGPGRGDER